MVLLLWYSLCCRWCNKLTVLITPADNPLAHMKLMNHMFSPVPTGEMRADLSHRVRECGEEAGQRQVRPLKAADSSENHKN